MGEITWVRLDLLPFVGMFIFDTDEEAGKKIKDIARAFATKDMSHPYAGPMLFEATEKREKRAEAGSLGGKAKSAKRSNASENPSNAVAMLEQCCSNASKNSSNALASYKTEQDITIQENTDPHTPVPGAALADPDHSVVVNKISTTNPPQAAEYSLPGIDPPEHTKRAPDPLSGEISAIVEAWNTMAASAGIPQIEITDKRKAKIRTRLNDKRFRGTWRDAIGMVGDSPFLRGEVKEFKASFDFFMKPDNYVKILEGTYAEVKQKPKMGIIAPGIYRASDYDENGEIIL